MKTQDSKVVSMNQRGSRGRSHRLAKGQLHWWASPFKLLTLLQVIGINEQPAFNDDAECTLELVAGDMAAIIDHTVKRGGVERRVVKADDFAVVPPPSLDSAEWQELMASLEEDYTSEDGRVFYRRVADYQPKRELSALGVDAQGNYRSLCFQVNLDDEGSISALAESVQKHGELYFLEEEIPKALKKALGLRAYEHRDFGLRTCRWLASYADAKDATKAEPESTPDKADARSRRGRKAEAQQVA